MMVMKQNRYKHKWLAGVAGISWVTIGLIAYAQQAAPNGQQPFDALMQGQPLPETAMPDVVFPEAQLPDSIPPAIQPVLPDPQLPPGIDAMQVPAIDPMAPPVAATEAEKAVASLPAPAPVLPPEKLSIGLFDLTIMYTSEDINNLKKVLEIFESRRPEQSMADATPADGDLLAELLRAAKEGDGAAEEEVLVLPSFHLGSIMYRQAGDWSLWVNRQRFTPSELEDNANGIRVTSVSRDMATLVWKPTNVVPAFQRRQQLQQNPGVRVNSHREARQSQLEFNEAAGEFTVSLKPNQTFVAESMQIMEGRTGFTLKVEEEAAADAAKGTNPNAEKSAGASGRYRGATGKERQLADKLVNNVKKMNKILPVGAQAK
jgi:hypothetical protein